jgi:hypothetical protein
MCFRNDAFFRQTGKVLRHGDRSPIRYQGFETSFVYGPMLIWEWVPVFCLPKISPSKKDFSEFRRSAKKYFFKKEGFFVFDQHPFSDAGQCIYRGPLRRFQGREREFPLWRSNKHLINTLSEPYPGPFP